MTTIRYFVPEDGDSEEHPNIFLLPKTQNTGFSPRLQEIKDNFPMPGTYHFRFKSALIPGSDREKNAVSVWMDCVNDNQHVGVWRNSIVAKVTRVNMDEDEEDFGGGGVVGNGSANVPTPRASSTPQRTQPRNVQPPPSQPPAPARPSPPQVSDNLLGLDDNLHTTTTTTTPHNPAPSSGEGSLLDMNLSDPSQPVRASSSHDDFLGMTSTPVAPTPAPSVPAASSIPNGIQSAPNSYGAQQRKSSTPRAGKAFDTFAQQSGPFGGLNWE